MTKKKQELLELLRTLRLLPDKEEAHVLADEALVEYIRDVEIKNAYHDVEKWYA